MAHSWSDGKCSTCDYSCQHPGWSDGKCTTCGTSCTHPGWSDGKCTTCDYSCQHPGWSDGKCTTCDYSCQHPGWSDGKCTTCGTSCAHSWSNGKCSVCNEVCTHNWVDGVCKTCNSTCVHDYDSSTGVCRTCKLACSHDKTAVDDAVAATCTATGLTEGKHCTTCGKVIVEQQTVEPKGHEFKTYVYNDDASCTADGTETARCVRYGTGGCKETHTRTAVGTMKNHTEVIDAAVDPTCTETGLTQGKHCSVCQKVLVKQNVISAKGHSEVTDSAVAPTCTKTGLTEGKHCSVCQTVLVKQNVVPAKGHSEVIDAAVDATCTETGLTQGKHCSVCQEVLVKQDVVPAKGHSEVTDAAVAPTCTETGLTEGKHCSVCQQVLVKQNEVPAKGHSEVVDAAVAPTCTETGLTEGKHCSVCQTVLMQQQPVPALGHDYTAKKTLPSCTKGGYTTYTCSRCADSYRANQTAKLNHLYGEWTPNGDGTSSATCMREGCGYVKTEACEAELLGLIVSAQEDAQTHALCPICGAVDDGSRLELVEQAAAVAVDGEKLPNAALVLRLGALENGERLMSLCFENDGQMVRFVGQAKFTLPAELLEGYELKLLGVDGVETDLPFTMEEGIATFTLEFAEEGELYALIRLVPVA